MIRFTALNQHEEPTAPTPVVDLRDLELRQCQEKLNLALNHLNFHNDDTAKGILKELIGTELIQESLEPIEKGSYLGQASLQHQIQFAVFKNFAEILQREFQRDRRKRTAEDAVIYYKKALYIDSTDRHSAYNLATLFGSEVIDNRALALKFSNLGLHSPSPGSTTLSIYSPLQWACLEELARLHWDLGTFETSLELCDIGLKAEPNNSMLNQLKTQLMQTWVTNFLSSDYYWSSPQTKPTSYGTITRRIRATVLYNERPQILHFPLKACTWKGMAETLLEIYKDVNKSRKRSEQGIPPRDCPVIIDIIADIPSDESRDVDDVPSKRKRKEAAVIIEPTDEKGSLTVRSSKRVRHKLEKNDFKKQRDLAAVEFTTKIEEDFRPYDAEYFIKSDGVDSEIILHYFEKVWTQTSYNEAVISASVEESINYSCKAKAASNVGLSMFSSHTNRPPIDNFFHEEVTKKNLPVYGQEANAKKLPISNHIREFIIHLFMTPFNNKLASPIWCRRWPDELKERVRDLLKLEGEQIVEYLDETCRFSPAISPRETESTVNDYCEKVWYIRKAMETILGIMELLWDSKMPKLGSQGFEEDEACSSYYPMTPKTIFDKCISSIQNVEMYLCDIIDSGSSFSKALDWIKCLAEYDEWIRVFNVRYHWSRSQIELCRGQFSAAMKCLELCRSSFDIYASTCSEDEPVIVMPNFFYDAHISKATIENKIRWVEIDDSLPKDEWSRSVRYFCECVNLLNNAVSMGINDDQIVQFWTIINTINEQLFAISDRISHCSSIAGLFQEDRVKFKNSVRLLYKLLLEILFPQDEQLVNSTGESIVGTLLNVFCVRMAVLLFKILSVIGPNVSKDNLAGHLSTMHKQLGNREMCGSDNGAFLKLSLTVLPSLNPSEYQEQAFQCSYCLYGFTLGVDMDPPEEHHTERLKLDTQAAEIIFQMIGSSITEKSLRTGQLKTGIKDALDEIATLVGPPPSQNVSVQMYRNWIETYLRTDIDFEDSLLHQYVDYRLAKSKTSDKPEIQKQLYYLRGKIFLYQYRTRSKANQTKAVFVLQNAAEQFSFDLYYNPHRFASWYSLATCYASLAAESMTWSAAEIQSNFFAIAVYQKMSFLCYSLAAKIKESPFGPQESIPYSELVNFWRDYGYHVYSMTTEPMSMASFYPRLTSLPVPAREDCYSFAAYCLGQALKYEKMEENELNSNGRDWRIPYMLGKCMQKLGRDPQVVLRLYKMAFERTPERSGISGQERIFDAEYKLTSTLAKFLFHGQIEPTIVKKYLDGESNNSGDSSNSLKSHKVRISQDKRYAFDLIFARLAEIRKNDKPKWLHRPVYRHAWLLYHVEHNPHEAKTVLQNLFQLKTSSKTVMNVWKPEFERAGRHFVYVHSYIKFLIELAKVTRDIDCLNNLESKLRKAQNILLKDAELSEALQGARLSLQPPQPSTVPSSEVPHQTIPSQSSAFTQLPNQSSLSTNAGTLNSTSSHQSANQTQVLSLHRVSEPAQPSLGLMSANVINPPPPSSSPQPRSNREGQSIIEID
ncbi:hypothetical protein G9A89_009999 [Geosiphon pyriformis]|nr:hypothetical protein G9A89_009999 [Geosiphon pyriformis]